MINALYFYFYENLIKISSQAFQFLSFQNLIYKF